MIRQWTVYVMLGLLAMPSLQSTAFAANVWLSLNLQFNTLGDFNSGGTWTTVAKAHPQGIAGISMFLANATTFESFLAPPELDVRDQTTIASVRNIVIGDDLVPPFPLGIGVIGSSFPSTYVDPAGIMPFGTYPDYGSFTGGVPLATGTFAVGVVPEWTVLGLSHSDANLFTGPGPSVADAETLLTVRYIIPEPPAFLLLAGVGMCAIAMRCRRRTIHPIETKRKDKMGQHVRTSCANSITVLTCSDPFFGRLSGFNRLR